MIKCRSPVGGFVAMWAEIDIKDKALIRVWNEAYGPNGFRKKDREKQ